MPSLLHEKTLADEMLKGHEMTWTVDFPTLDPRTGKTTSVKLPLWKVAEMLAYIQNKEGKNVPFRLNYAQCRFYLSICEMREQGKPVQVNILKARQLGMSTGVCVLYSIFALFTPNTSVGIVADTLEHANGLFEKCMYVYKNLDLNNPYREYIEAENRDYMRYSFKPRLATSRQGRVMKTEDGSSTIEVMAVGDNAGRSKTYTMLHCSEVAFWPGMEKTFVSLFQTVPFENRNAIITLETTANGCNEFKSRWDRDIAGGDVSFKPFFVSWFDNPAYVLKVPDGYDVERSFDRWELEKWHKDHPSIKPEQMFWFHVKYLNLGRDKNAALQEYPFDPIDAFVSSGSSVFDRTLIDRRKAEIIEAEKEKPARRGSFVCKHLANADQSQIEVPESSIEFIESGNGAIKIFEEAKPGHPYVVTCDPNMGGSDFIAMQVVDNYTGHQVARFLSRDYANDQAAYQLYCLGRMYNWALASSETNVGQIVMELLVRCKYPRIYIQQADSYQSVTRGLAMKYGHRTTTANRQYMIDSLVKAFREDPEMVRDYDTICEMEAFQLVERVDKSGNVTKSKQEAAGGAHDDLVMSLAAFYVVRVQQTAIVDERAENLFNREETLADINERILREKRLHSEVSLDRSMGILW